MRLCVTSEQRFIATPDGQIWLPQGGTYSWSFWRRYLDVFDGVKVIARVGYAAVPDPQWKRSDGEGVSFARVPDYSGPFEYLMRRASVAKAVRAAIQPDDALILRVGSQIAACLTPLLKSGRVFALEVVGDPHGFFAPGNISHPLRALFRTIFTRRLREQCRRAHAVAYVTREFLQRLYPAGEHAFSTYYSSVELTEESFVQVPRQYGSARNGIRIITVASLALPNKGVDTLIDAVSACVKQGTETELVVVGDGRCRSDFEKLVLLRGLGSRVRFLGALPSGASVRKQLDSSDLFILAAKGGDGLPRAMIEAMARALPCLGTDVAGIPELLEKNELVTAGDPHALAAKIRELASDVPRLERLSSANLIKAGAYRDSILQKRRRNFYEYVRNAAGQLTAGKAAQIDAPLRAVSRSNNPCKRLLIQVTVPSTLLFFRNQLHWLKNEGLTIHVVASPGKTLQEFATFEEVIPHPIPMSRNVALLADVAAVFRTASLYRRLQPHIVHGFTPKGGLVSMVAAFLTRRPVRVYTIFGFVHTGSRGFKRRLLAFTERLACAFAHRVYCECESIKQLAVQENICAENKMRVIPAWSLNQLSDILERSCGRDTYRSQTRQALGIPTSDFVIGFVGRIVPDKGIQELVEAFLSLRQRFDKLHLLLTGDVEAEHPLPFAIAEKLRGVEDIHITGWTKDVVSYLAAMDVLVHPSYREGLPSAPIEASAMGLPVVLTKIPGCVDAVKENVTGILIPPKDSRALAEAVADLIHDPNRRAALGQAGREWVRQLLREPIWEALAADYLHLLHGTAEGSTLRVQRPILDAQKVFRE